MAVHKQVVMTTPEEEGPGTHTRTRTHTLLKSRDIFLLGNLSINQCDFKHISQATRLT